MNDEPLSRTRASEQHQVTSSVHPNRACKPCALCKKANQSKYFHLQSMKDNSLLQTLQRYEPSLDIQPDSCICRPCRNELLKDFTEVGFVPRWRKVDKSPTLTCFVPGCINSATRMTKLASKETLSKFFSSCENLDPLASPADTEEGIPLCTEHYGEWYRNYACYKSSLKLAHFSCCCEC